MHSLIHDKIPLFVLINFLLLIQLLLLNWKYIWKVFAKIDKAIWMKLAAIFTVALSIRLFVPPIQHIMYVDEPWYMEAAKNMLQSGRQGLYPKAIGWPFILSFFFGIFEVSNWVALYASIIIGALTSVSVFFMAFAITDKKNVSLLSALLISMYPVHIRWSATAETNVASLFFISVTIFFAFIYYREKKYSLLWLSLVSTAFAAQFRPENCLFFVLFLFGCFLFDAEKIKKAHIKYFLPWLTSGILCLPNFIHVAYFYTTANFLNKGAQAKSIWHVSNSVYDALQHMAYVFNGEFQPMVISFFVFLGVGFMFFKQKKELLFMLLWFFLLWFVYFYSWFQTLGGGTGVNAESRFFMSFYPVLAVLASYGVVEAGDGLSRGTKGVLPAKGVLSGMIALIILAFIPYIKLSSELFSSDRGRLETKIPELAERDLPADCVILATEPSILTSTTNLSVVDADVFLKDQEYQSWIRNNRECILFFDDLTCSLQDSAREICQEIRSKFQLKEFRSYTEGSEKYSFYKVGEHFNGPVRIQKKP